MASGTSDDSANRDILRARIRLLHQQGERLHRRFLAAVAARDRAAMSRLADEHAAVNTEAITLIDRLRESIARRIARR